VDETGGTRRDRRSRWTCQWRESSTRDPRFRHWLSTCIRERDKSPWNGARDAPTRANTSDHSPSWWGSRQGPESGRRPGQGPGPCPGRWRRRSDTSPMTGGTRLFPWVQKRRTLCPRRWHRLWKRASTETWPRARPRARRRPDKGTGTGPE
jgi:hypothetical protein